MNRHKRIPYNFNEGIRHPKIRIIGDGIESKICTVVEAIRIADDLGLDVVETNNKVDPPICKIIALDKLLYEEKKKAKELEKRNREQRVDVKEIRLTPNTDTHDIEFKSRHAKNFLTDGDKVKVVMKFGGREMAHKEIGEKLMLEFVQRLEEIGTPEFLPKFEGKRLYIIIKPIK